MCFCQLYHAKVPIVKYIQFILNTIIKYKISNFYVFSDLEKYDFSDI